MTSWSIYLPGFSLLWGAMSPVPRWWSETDPILQLYSQEGTKPSWSQTSYHRDGCTGPDIKFRAMRKTRIDGRVRISCSRLAQGKSVRDYHHGLADTSRSSKLGRILCQYVVLRTTVSLPLTHTHPFVVPLINLPHHTLFPGPHAIHKTPFRRQWEYDYGRLWCALKCFAKRGAHCYSGYSKYPNSICVRQPLLYHDVAPDPSNISLYTKNYSSFNSLNG